MNKIRIVQDSNKLWFIKEIVTPNGEYIRWNEYFRTEEAAKQHVRFILRK